MALEDPFLPIPTMLVTKYTSQKMKKDPCSKGMLYISGLNHQYEGHNILQARHLHLTAVKHYQAEAHAAHSGQDEFLCRLEAEICDGPAGIKTACVSGQAASPLAHVPFLCSPPARLAPA